MRQVDLLNGRIVPSLAKLAFPIMGTSLIQMAYNLTDMIWIGRVGSGAVAAVGAAGMYLWMANGLAAIPRMGGQVKAAHAMGSGDMDGAADFVAAALQMTLGLTALCTFLYLAFSRPLIAFFRLNQAQVVQDAHTYLVIVAAGLVFAFLNQTLTGVFTAMGNSLVTFRATAVGLGVNIVLDPLLIFGFGPIPSLGVAGAALATVLAQAIVSALFVWAALHERTLFARVRPWRRTQRASWAGILRIGLPVSLQNIFFSSLSMIIARLVAGWGDDAVAVQKVGSQIESISWMTAEGFSTAVNAFVAQNFGAGKRERIRRGYWSACGLMAAWSIFTSAVLLLFPQALFRIFIPDPAVLPMGVDYLRILGLSQLFMCMESVVGGAFQGLGKPIPPTVVSVIFNAGRIPLAMLLSATALGLNGIWWAITLSSMLKGLVLPIWFAGVLAHYLRAGKNP